MTKKIAKGFTFRKPNGDLDWRVVRSIDAAQSNAAFDITERSSIELPKDWERAYALGYRIESATVLGGASNKAWKEWKPD